MSAAIKTFLIISTQPLCVAGLASLSGRLVSALKVAKAVAAHKRRVMGTSRCLMAVAYFLVPELTTPQRNMKIEGAIFATSFAIQTLHQTISSQLKNQTIRTAPIWAFGVITAVTTMGTAK